MTLNPRLYTLKPHPVQYRLWTEEKRFKVVPAGRRSGKTELGKRKLIEAAYEGTMFPDARFFASAPTRDQAKRIFWTDLKAMVNMQYVSSIMESELKIEFVNASEIHVIGMDKPERIEGTPWDGGIMDEYGNMKKKAWPENVRPSLSDRMGWCWLIGVPEGRNHYYNTYREAKADTSNLWGAYHWISADILPPQEIEAAKRDLDLRTYEQEYEASFVNYAGMAYYCFDEKYSVGKLEYDPINPLIFCFDFNESPGVAVVCQEQWLPDRGDGSKIFGTGVIGEVYSSFK